MGASVAGIADANGDGRGDIAIGSYGYDSPPAGLAGKVEVFAVNSGLLLTAWPGYETFRRWWAEPRVIRLHVLRPFAPDWSHTHVAAFLGEKVEGYLLGDGYAGYGTLVTKYPALIEAGCWAHVLRKFREALKESPVEAGRMMRRIAQLFELEREADEQKLTPEARLLLRREKSQAVLTEIQAELAALRGGTSDQGPLAKALGYLEHQWPTLVRFLEDGRLPIHNNSCENAIRTVAVGRRNWLFAGSERGGQAAATIYSLVESCRRVDVDPFVYLRDVLVRVCTHPASRLRRLPNSQ